MSTLLKLSALALSVPLMIGCVHHHHYHDRCEDDRRISYRSYSYYPAPRHEGYRSYEVRGYRDGGRWGSRCD